MKIAVWYHCVLNGPRIPKGDGALSIVVEQMSALRESGLSLAADQVNIGVNGSPGDALTVLSLAPDHAKLYASEKGESELATMIQLQAWLQPGWLVLYHHIKGVTYPNNLTWQRWRRCMERICVWNWEQCVKSLAEGADTAGAHWMRNSRCNIIPKGQKYWGGNFWWARSDYLMRLPTLAKDSYENRYEAEVWIGKSPSPSFVDFAPHFPMNCPK